MTTHVTIYRDSLGLPAWATVTGECLDSERSVLKAVHDAILEGNVAFGFDGDIEVEVV